MELVNSHDGEKQIRSNGRNLFIESHKKNTLKPDIFGNTAKNNRIDLTSANNGD